MLMRTDSFRDLDRIAQQLLGAGGRLGTWSRPNPMPMDTCLAGDAYVVRLDLPVSTRRRSSSTWSATC
jgi:HSP20 family protein